MIIIRLRSYLPFEDSFSLDLGMVEVTSSFLYFSLSLHEGDDFL